MAEEVFAKALRQPIGFYETHGVSDSITRFTTDVDFLSAGLGAVLAKLVREPLKVVGMVAIAAAIDLRLTLITLAVFPVVFGTTAYLARKIRRRAQGVLEARSGHDVGGRRGARRRSGPCRRSAASRSRRRASPRGRPASTTRTAA